jgi:hypothetical protein
VYVVEAPGVRRISADLGSPTHVHAKIGLLIRFLTEGGWLKAPVGIGALIGSSMPNTETSPLDHQLPAAAPMPLEETRDVVWRQPDASTELVIFQV